MNYFDAIVNAYEALKINNDHDIVISEDGMLVYS